MLVAVAQNEDRLRLRKTDKLFVGRKFRGAELEGDIGRTLRRRNGKAGHPIGL
jgi:hypothetical protein